MSQLNDYELTSVNRFPGGGKVERLIGIDESNLGELLKNYKSSYIWARGGIISAIYEENNGNSTLIIMYMRKDLKNKRLNFAKEIRKLRNRFEERNMDE